MHTFPMECKYLSHTLSTQFQIFRSIVTELEMKIYKSIMLILTDFQRIRTHLFLFLLILWSDTQNQACVNSCQTYPSEYAYHEATTVSRSERTSANCRMYPSDYVRINEMAFPHHYIHCNGTQLRLTDSDLGSEQYKSSDYYEWSTTATTRQLLFIFPTRVNLTNITLHYYSDSARGLLRLRFYALPDDFEVWDALIASYSHVEVAPVPPGGETAGQKKVNININFNTRKVIMISLNSAFKFAVSEVEFSTCSVRTTAITSESNNFVSRSNTNADILPITLEVNKSTTELIEPFQNSTSPNNNQFIPEISQLNIVLPVVVTAIVVTIVLVVLLVLLLQLYCKRKHNLTTTVELEATYSTLDRGTKLQTKLESTDASAILYDQIQLSPSTGQTEHILFSKTESKHVIGLTSPSTSDYQNMEKQQERHTEKSNIDYATYTVVDKKKKNKSKKEELNESQDRAPENVCAHKDTKSLKDVEPEEYDDVYVEKREDQQSQRKENLEEMYAVVQKKPKKCEEQGEIAPPIPSHTIESLYTAVEKKPK